MPGFLIGNMNTNEGAYAKADYMMQYTWEIPNIFGKKKIDIQNNDSRNAMVMLKECSTPTFVANQEKYVASNLQYKYADYVSWDDVRVSWYDTNGLLDLLREWRKSVWSEEAGLQPATNYKRNTQISCYDQSGRNKFGWILRNSWPSTIKNGDLTYTASDVKIVEVTITYDWAEECNEGLSRLALCPDFIF